NQVESNVTKADVDAAKANLDTANQAVSVQEQVVNDATTVADEAQSAYDQAQQSTSDTQNLVDQATPENIASAQDDINSAQEQVSQADTAEKIAENTVAQAQEAVNNQTEVVNSAQTAVDAAQSDVDAAQKDVNDKQAILDGTGQAEIIANRDNAQAAVNTAQDHVSQTESDLTKAQEADANRQQAIDNAQQAVDEANQTVTSSKSDLDAKIAQANQTQAIEDAKQADVTTAQKDVNEKQAILDGTGQKAILDEAEAAKADEANKQANLSAAQSALKQAQAADANRQQAIDNAQQAVDEATQNVSTTKSDLDAKTAQAQQAAQALESAQTAYTTAENDYKSINTIRLSQAYVDALKVYADRKATTEQKAKATEILKVESARLAKENVFKVNPSDDNVVEYDINNLPETVKQEISLFASDLINQIRKTFGTPETVVTTSSIKFADLVTSGYVADHWSVAAAQQAGAVGHDAKAVNEAAAYFGLPTTSKEAEAKGWQYYENFGAETGFKSKQSLAVLKNNIYTVLWNFMFDAGEWYHASSIVGVDKKLNSLTDKTYFAVEPSDPGFYKGFHFLLIDSPDVISATKKNFDTTQIVNPYSSDKIIATYNTAKADLEAKTATNNSVQSALSAAQNNYNNAVAINTKAQQVLDEAQSVAVQTPTAQANLTLAETALTKA
ncbi:SEC10/PgrA surface exclusion domain-containing protein, partial [Streptococcus pasteurianus]|nr:SEC10/PgrA surface exclusion domain-containing protein [Streptococcus pasteurianus]